MLKFRYNWSKKEGEKTFINVGSGNFLKDPLGGSVVWNSFVTIAA